MDTAISIIFFVVGVYAVSYLFEVITKGNYLSVHEGNEILFLCVFLPLTSVLIWIQFNNFHLMSWSYLIGFTIVSSILLDVISYYLTIFLAKYLIKSKAEEAYNLTIHELDNYRGQLNLRNVEIFNRKEFEYKIEFLVVYENITKGLGWWSRTKRRFELVKKYRNM